MPASCRKQLITSSSFSIFELSLSTMRITLLLNTLATLAFASPVEKRAATVCTYVTDGVFTSAEQYANLVRYAKFSSTAYADSCANPNGAILVQEVSNNASDTQGYVARDDVNKEIIVALRGSTTIEDVLTDAGTVLVPCVSLGVPYPSNAFCHQGFQSAWNSVAGSLPGSLVSSWPRIPGTRSP